MPVLGGSENQTRPWVVGSLAVIPFGHHGVTPVACRIIWYAATTELSIQRLAAIACTSKRALASSVPEPMKARAGYSRVKYVR